MPNKVTLELSPGQVEGLIESLSLEDKIRLVRKLENETWASRLDEVVFRIRKRFKQSSLTDKEIRQICEETRQKLYNARAKSNN